MSDKLQLNKVYTGIHQIKVIEESNSLIEDQETSSNDEESEDTDTDNKESSTEEKLTKVIKLKTEVHPAIARGEIKNPGDLILLFKDLTDSNGSSTKNNKEDTVETSIEESPAVQVTKEAVIEDTLDKEKLPTAAPEKTEERSLDMKPPDCRAACSIKTCKSPGHWRKRIPKAPDY